MNRLPLKCIGFTPVIKKSICYHPHSVFKPLDAAIMEFMMFKSRIKTIGFRPCLLDLHLNIG